MRTASTPCFQPEGEPNRVRLCSEKQFIVARTPDCVPRSSGSSRVAPCCNIVLFWCGVSGQLLEKSNRMQKQWQVLCTESGLHCTRTALHGSAPKV